MRDAPRSDGAKLRPGPVVDATDVLHLDMDSFFVAVEVLADPSLAGRPVVVGGTGPRSVVASASYEARVFGVRSAMPIGEARRRCPGLVVISSHHDEYEKTSVRLFGLCHEVTPVVEPISIDEAFLDLSGAHGLLGDSWTIATGLRQRVLDELGLACAIGVGRTKLVAKLASKAAKPRVRPDGFDPGAGVVLVAPADELAFLHAHPVRAVPGVGPATAERLRRIGVTTVGDLALVGRKRLIAMFGESHGTTLCDLAAGRDDRRVVTDRVVHSIGHERTFDVDDHDLESLTSKARELAVSVAARCRARGVAARTISVKVRFGDFETIERSRSLDRPVTTAGEIAHIAQALLATVDLGRGVRLLGVSVSHLGEVNLEHAAQLGLFVDTAADPDNPGPTDPGGVVEQAADEIRRRFGPGAITSVAAAGRRTRPARRRPGPERR
jgi:DNA polymerase-4